MKKLLKKISVMALALTLSFSAFAGCNKPREADQKLEVFIANRGYGIDGVLGALNAFKEQDWVKAKYPNLEIKPTDDRTPQVGINIMRAPKKNTYDLVFVIEDFAQFFDAEGKTLVDLTDVYESTVPNEIKTVEEKMLDVAKDYTKWNVPGTEEYRYYDMTWCTGYTGMIYNPKIIRNYVKEDPRTTQEVIELLVKIKNGDTIDENGNPNKPANYDTNESVRKAWNKQNCGNEDGYGIAPCGSATYDSNLYEILWAQYDGYTEYNVFWDGKVINQRGNAVVDADKMFAQEGRLYSLEFIRETIAYENKYYDLKLSNTDYIPGLTTFLKGQYAMVNCSDYFDTETKLTREEMIANVQAGKAGATLPEQLYILKAPIVSEIVNKLGKYNGQLMTDEQLSFLIKCIDEEMAFNDAKAAFSQEFTGVTELRVADYNKLLEARAIVKAPGTTHTVAIPAVSNSIDVAKDFLRFMATDVCQLAYMKGSAGQTLPFTFDPANEATLYGTTSTTKAAYDKIYRENVSEMQKSRLDIIFNTFNPIKTICVEGRKPLSDTQFKSIVISGDIGRTLREKDAPTAQKLFDDTKTIMNQTALDRYLFEAGLSDSGGY